jgi:hypothetical protein
MHGRPVLTLQHAAPPWQCHNATPGHLIGDTRALRRGLGLLKSTKHVGLLSSCLEAAMAELGGGVDEFELDFLQRRAAGLRKQRLAQSDGPLLASRDSSLQVKSGCLWRSAVEALAGGAHESELRPRLLVPTRSNRSAPKAYWHA